MTQIDIAANIRRRIAREVLEVAADLHDRALVRDCREVLAEDPRRLRTSKAWQRIRDFYYAMEA